MTQEEMQLFDRGHNQGVFYGVQLATSEILRVLDSHERWMLPTDRRQAYAAIKMEAERILQKRGLMPYSYDVLMGKAEKVELDFNMKS
jgi:hypothetical protein